MDIQALIGMLTDGLPAEQAAVVKAAIERDAVKAKVSTFRQADEYQALVDKAANLEREMNGDAAQNRLGAKAYQDWYTKNEAEIAQFVKARQEYVNKYGKLDGFYERLNADGTQQTQQTQQTSQPNRKEWTEDDIARAVDARIQAGYAPRWADLLKGTGQIVQKHMFAGRKEAIDFAKLEEIATKQTGGDLMRAYDIYDEPEREKSRQASQEAEINRRVNEELQKRGAHQGFPAAADAGPSALSANKGDKFDKSKLTDDLVNTWNKAGSQELTSRGSGFFGGNGGVN